MLELQRVMTVLEQKGQEQMTHLVNVAGTQEMILGKHHETLYKIDKLEEKVDAVHKELHVMAPVVSYLNPDELEILYCRYLLSCCEFIPGDAVDLAAAGGETTKLALQDVFTTLEVSNYERAIEVDGIRARTYDGFRISVIESCSQNRTKHSVLLGKPGSGKSTLVDYIAFCLAATKARRDDYIQALRQKGWQLGWLIAG